MKDRKKVIIFVGWFYPGFKGAGQSTSCLNLVFHLHKDYDVFIFTRGNDYGSEKDYDEVNLNEWVDFKGIAKIYYCKNSTLSFYKVYNALKKVRPNIVYLNGMFSFNLTIVPILINRFLHFKVKIILVPRGMLMDGKIQFKKAKKVLFIKAFTFLGLQKRILIQATSAEEKTAVKKRLNVNDNQIYIIPNIPSTDLFIYYTPVFKNKNELKIYFASRIAREKNVLYALEVVKSLNLPIQFDIWGSIDHEEYWEKCTQLIKNFPNYIKVKYRGIYKPEHIRSCFENYHIFLFPTFGENYGHVIIEALALGKPVIITQNTPWIDLEEKKAGWIIDLENEKRYVEVLKSLFEMSQKEYNSYSMAAYRYACNHINEVDYKSLYRKLFD